MTDDEYEARRMAHVHTGCQGGFDEGWEAGVSYGIDIGCNRERATVSEDRTEPPPRYVVDFCQPDDPIDEDDGVWVANALSGPDALTMEQDMREEAVAACWAHRDAIRDEAIAEGRAMERADMLPNTMGAKSPSIAAREIAEHMYLTPEQYEHLKDLLCATQYDGIDIGRTLERALVVEHLSKFQRCHGIEQGDHDHDTADLLAQRDARVHAETLREHPCGHGEAGAWADPSICSVCVNDRLQRDREQQARGLEKCVGQFEVEQGMGGGSDAPWLGDYLRDFAGRIRAGGA